MKKIMYHSIPVCSLFILFACNHGSAKTKASITETTVQSTIVDTEEKAEKDSAMLTDSIQFAIIPKGKNDKYEWKPAWNECIAEQILKQPEVFIHNDSLPFTDLVKLCPNFIKMNQDEKVAFWVLVIASMAKFESNFDPNCRFKEDGSLNYVYSEGLLQLSYGDETRHKGILIDPNKQNILDPKVNLQSGVVILANQLKKRKHLFTQKHYYWSVLTNKQKEIIDFFATYSGGLKHCE